MDKKKGKQNYIDEFLKETGQLARQIDRQAIEKIITLLEKIRRQKGRLFFLGVGGGAANASHAVNDFRKIAGFEAYTPTDNVSELTALINDEGWLDVFSSWLKESRLSSKDAIFILSIGGGNRQKKISENLIKAIDLARKRKAKVLGIVAREDGYTAQKADACVVIPCPSPERLTPHGEAWQALLLHLIVSHPRLKAKEMKWEATK
jgi:D-sedoheptulose 7-phosphate isomerase